MKAYFPHDATEKTAIISLSRTQLQALAICLDETLKAIDDCEFQTRLGVEPHDARTISTIINQALNHNQ